MGSAGLCRAESGARRHGRFCCRVRVVKRRCPSDRFGHYGITRHAVVAEKGPKNWGEVLAVEDAATVQQLRQSTYSGRPFGTESFVVEIGKKIGRTWVRGRPKKNDPASVPAVDPADQFSLF